MFFLVPPDYHSPLKPSARQNTRRDRTFLLQAKLSNVQFTNKPYELVISIIKSKHKRSMTWDVYYIAASVNLYYNGISAVDL